MLRIYSSGLVSWSFEEFLLLAFDNRSDIVISASRFFVCMRADRANNIVKRYLWIL